MELTLAGQPTERLFDKPSLAIPGGAYYNDGEYAARAAVTA
jgi:hypothetical protein